MYAKRRIFVCQVATSSGPSRRRLIHRSAWKVNSRKSAKPRSYAPCFPARGRGVPSP
jgi:hypothetical protein